MKALDYKVTTDRYERWVAAQRALDSTPGLPAPPKLDPLHLGEPDLERAIAYLESDQRARAALARAGISARDYVLTTVALDQALVAGAPPATSGRAGRTTGTSIQPAPLAASPRPRVTGAPAQNVELVQRNRADLVRVLRTMRFRISEPTAEDLADTTARRVDSMTLGKDITVKWDITVRRNRDSTARDTGRKQAPRPRPAPADSSRPDSTAPETSHSSR